MTRADVKLKVQELKAEADFLERFIEDTGNAGMLTHQHLAQLVAIQSTLEQYFEEMEHGEVEQEELVEYIQASLNIPERLMQLAEEASEMSQAALKLARKINGVNPTPKSLADCVAALREEISDTMTCLAVLHEDRGWMEPSTTKLTRWVERLKEAEENADCEA